ncbi:MAG: ATP-binding protein [Sedimentisphaerales bacterium]
MENKRLEAVLAQYNPWWTGERSWQQSLPDYKRPVVDSVLADLKEIGQVISITGPRRVGKSTALMHIISSLIDHHKIDPKRILYFSFDDPDIFASQEFQSVIFDLLIERTKKFEGTCYFFLDEIQRLPRWELYVKKYYDLKTSVRFIISGSASSPIFRSSQESLLGRIKDHHLLPFSFREFCQYRLLSRPSFSQIIGSSKNLRQHLLNRDGPSALQCLANLHKELEPFENDIDQALMDYCLEGGFPEVWVLPDSVRKIEYLMEQQVRKVLYEDLMTVTQYRKPENVLRFFVYLLAHPGMEINTVKISQESGVERRVVEENLPRLEMTDLIIRIQKFRHQPLRVRQGNIKCYPVDMALRNAVLKTWTLPDSAAMGLYAENLVIRELITWPELIEISYFREKDHEVDFVLTYAGSRYLPIEVKHRKQAEQITGLKRFAKIHKPKLAVVITADKTSKFDDFLYLPLKYFLLAS